MFLSRSRSCACCSGVQHKDKRREPLVNIPGGDTRVIKGQILTTTLGRARCYCCAHKANSSRGKSRVTEKPVSVFLAPRVKKAEHNWPPGDVLNFSFVQQGFKKFLYEKGHCEDQARRTFYKKWGKGKRGKATFHSVSRLTRRLN